LLWTNNDLLPEFRPSGAGISGVLAQIGGAAAEPFTSDIGGLLPIALCGLYLFKVSPEFA